MTPDDVPFESGWFGQSIPLYRSAGSAHARFELDSLPPVPKQYLDGTYSWLDEWAPDDPRLSPEGRDEIAADFDASMERVRTQARAFGFVLPREVIDFMTNVRLRRAICLATDQCLRWPDRIVAAPGDAGRFLVMFFAGGQDSMLWYLYLDRDSGKHCVVASEDYFGIDDTGEEGPETLDDAVFCAGAFQEFIFRSWVESSAWNQITLALPLNPI